MINGEVSYWWSSIGGPPRPRDPLPGTLAVDVCIVGAGYTGLWTAYHLKRAAPDLDVAVVEERFAGYGASGRNGGWLTNEITGGVAQYRRRHEPEVVDRFQQAMNDAVDEVIATTEAEGIDADIRRGGELTVARGAAQRERLAADYRARTARAHTDVVWLEQGEALAQANIAGTTAATWHPHCAKLHPAKLARGLSLAVERLGVRLHEGTRVTALEPHRVHTDHGDVTAPYVLRATEGYTARLPGLRRAWLPLNSSMVVTQPLDAGQWAEIGWDGDQTLGDSAHAYMYAQRTVDDRIALGGRGVPYRYGSRIVPDGRTDPRTVPQLRRILDAFFPALRDVALEHTWSGVLGVPRDWHATVGLDPTTGMGWAGGFVGTGVTATNLAGRTLRDLVLRDLGRGGDTVLTGLPWVDRRVRRWEPEPLRYLAVTALYRAYTAADAAEQGGRRTTSPIARAADVVSGRAH